MANFRSVSLATLDVGQVLGNPIYDPGQPNTKLLGAGVEVTGDLLARLRARGVRDIIVEERDLAKLSAFHPQGIATEAPDHRSGIRLHPTEARLNLQQRASSVENGLAVQKRGEPVSNRIQLPTGTYDKAIMYRAGVHFENDVEFGLGLIENLTSSGDADFDGLQARCEESLQLACEDLHLYCCLGVNPYSTDYPSRHGNHVAILATAIGIMYGLDDQALVDLAMGCQLHDAGMLLIPNHPYELKRQLSDRDFAAVAEHPDHTLRLLEGLDVPLQSQFVAAQIHERCNGDGYPAGSTADEIHELAKIAAVADTFVALVSKRPHRPGLQPYHAMLKMLDSVKHGLFDADAMRCLLQAVSLFPVGSYLAFDESCVGRVIRSNPDRYDRPTVEVWRTDAVQDDPSVVDLAEVEDLTIRKPLTSLPGR